MVVHPCYPSIGEITGRGIWSSKPLWARVKPYLRKKKKKKSKLNYIQSSLDTTKMNRFCQIIIGNSMLDAMGATKINVNNLSLIPSQPLLCLYLFSLVAPLFFRYAYIVK